MPKKRRQKGNKGRRKGRGGGTRGHKLAAEGRYVSVTSSRFSFLKPQQDLTFRYVQNVAFSMLTAVAQNQVFNLNSLFDPDRTGGGHQPYGFDQLSALYNRYRVMRASWRVSVSPVGGNMKMLVLPSNGLLNTAITDAATFVSACENPFAKWKTVPATGADPVSISGSFYLNELNGVTRMEYLGDDRFEAQVASSPTELIVLNCAILNDSTGTLAPNPTIELRYHSDLHDPISLASSLDRNEDRVWKKFFEMSKETQMCYMREMNIKYEKAKCDLLRKQVDNMTLQ